MGQAFFTLSLGIGSMAIFGSYIGKDHSLAGESVNIMVLDTIVALLAGLRYFRQRSLSEWTQEPVPPGFRYNTQYLQQHACRKGMGGCFSFFF